MGETSIPCRENTRDRLDGLRGGQYKSWDAFLNHMADVWTDRDGENVDLDGAIQDELERLVHDSSTGGERVSYDDVKSACQKAIRDELPDGVFR